MRRAVLCLPLAACAPGGVTWDAASSDDTVDDVAIALLTLGYAEDDDRALLDAPHATGSSLAMSLLDDKNGAVSRWTVESLAPEVCTVTTGDTRDGRLPVTFSFTGRGSTEVLVIDEAGAVVDWQPIAVRDAVGAEVRAYDALRLGESVELDTLHVVKGSEGSLVVNWFDATGAPLGGSGLLSATSANAQIGLDAKTANEGYETLDVWVDTSAEPGESTIELLVADVPVRQLPVVVHELHEVTEIVILDGSIVEEDGTTGGYARAQVLAGTEEIFGAVATWSVDGEEVGQGTWVRLGGTGEDDLHEITACRKRVCATATLPGTITAVEDAFASAPPSCGCDDTSGLPSAGLLLLAARLRRRRPA